jgi:hypothetical protein
MFLNHQVMFAGGDDFMFENEQFFNSDDLPPEFDADDDPPPSAPIDKHLFIFAVFMAGYGFYRYNKNTIKYENKIS